MVVVDTSVWINHFRGISDRETKILDKLLLEGSVATCDLIVCEILRGIKSESLMKQTQLLLLSVTVYELLSVQNAIRAAHKYRRLRSLGITVRNTADMLIASYCIDEGHSLLFADRDFLPFVKHQGLKAL